MNQSLIIALLSLLFIPLSASAQELVKSSLFHSPKTDSEVALAQIFDTEKMGGVENDAVESADGGAGRMSAKMREKKQKKMVHLNCENPINPGDTPFFYTVEEQDSWTAVMVIWRSANDTSDTPVQGPLYKMTRTDSGWKLDDIACSQ